MRGVIGPAKEKNVSNWRALTRPAWACVGFSVLAIVFGEKVGVMPLQELPEICDARLRSLNDSAVTYAP
jgi:hypothetical protein